MYVTPLVRKTIKILKTAKGPLSVTDIIFLLSKKEARPGKATLYRLLTGLAEKEVVQENIFSDETRRYSLVTNNRQQFYFICQSCGRSIELSERNCNLVANSLRTDLEKNGADVITCSIQMEGICGRCGK